MFVSTPNNQVIAIDAKSGNVLWRYRRPRPTGSNVPHDTSRGVALLRRQRLLRRGRGRPGGAGRENRARSLDHRSRRQQVGLLHLAGSADRRRQGDGRRVGRRVWNPRICRRIRSGNRQGAVAHLHHSRARRARQRNLAQGRPVEERRRLRLGHRQLRSGYEHRVLGRRQRRSLDGRQAARRQSLHLLDHRARRGDREDQGRTSNTIPTIPGIGTRCRRRSWWISSATAGPSRA